MAINHCFVVVQLLVVELSVLFLVFLDLLAHFPDLFIVVTFPIDVFDCNFLLLFNSLKCNCFILEIPDPCLSVLDIVLKLI